LLGSGHEVAVFHRCSDVGLADSGVVQIQGDRNRLSDYESQLRRFSPDVIVDLILSSGEQARQLVETAHEIARRVIAISSMDVYRAWGVMHEVEAGSLDPLPLTEDSPLRTTRRLYPPETVKCCRTSSRGSTSTTTRSRSKRPYGAILRCRGPSYGCLWCTAPGAPLHRFFPLLKRVADGRSTILFSEDLAAWRGAARICRERCACDCGRRNVGSGSRTHLQHL